MTQIEQIKTKFLQKRMQYRLRTFEQPDLRNLFLELTLRCNLYCSHCGSRCGDEKKPEMTAADFVRLLAKVKADFDISRIMLDITGGEPLLRRDFFDIAAAARQMGYRWGMTTNATLIDDAVARELKKTGMRTVSVSIDGLRQSHDALRNVPGAYDRAMAGIEALLRVGGFSSLQITTVVTRKNIDELEAMYRVFRNMDITSWRLTGIEPMGRARMHPDLLLRPEEHRRLLRFIKSEREQGMPLEYGCCHYLGLTFEREVRDWFFLCAAGRQVASIACNGDILACLDIERNEKTIQGNVLRDDFTKVWKERFQYFRSSLAERNEVCRRCPAKLYCDGDSFHSWDMENDAPLLCMRGILFEDDEYQTMESKINE